MGISSAGCFLRPRLPMLPSSDKNNSDEFVRTNKVQFLKECVYFGCDLKLIESNRIFLLFQVKLPKKVTRIEEHIS